MSKERKAKVAKKVAERNYKIDDVGSGIASPAPLKDMHARIPKMDGITAPASVMNEAGIKRPAAERPEGNLIPTDALKAKLPTKATAMTETGIASPAKAEAKPYTLSDMLAEQRKTVEKEKTDAVKMQKYYALTDVFNALGKMGGTVIGGAIGGNVMDSAPIIEAYQPNRGYINAFEKAKQANDRIRALDEKSFQLALRDEDRSYKQQEDKLNREWQKQMTDYKNAIDRANADRDYERSRQLKEDLANLQHQHDMELQRLKNQNRASEQAGSRANMQFQYDLYNRPIQVAFDDGTAVEVTDNQYKGLFNYLNGKTIGGKVVNKDSFDTVLRENPKIVNDYLKLFGGGASTAATTPNPNGVASKTESAKLPVHATGYAVARDAYNSWVEETPKNLVEANPDTIGFNIFSYERK